MAGKKQPIKNYFEIKVPEDKDPKKYNTNERRAELLQMIMTAGHPDAIGRVESARRYGVTHVAIVKDIQVLGECMKHFLGDKVRMITPVVFNRVIRDLMKGTNKDKFNAAKLLGDWNSWMFDTGLQEKVADKIDLKSEGGMSYDEAYKQVLLQQRVKRHEEGNKGNQQTD